MEKADPTSPVKPPAKPARKAVQYPPEFHREFPQAPDAEKGILSSVLLAPQEVYPWACENGISADSFYIPANGIIWTALGEIIGAAKSVDFITIAQHLRDRNQLDQVGGAAGLNELFVYLPTAANAGYYVEIVLEKHLLRRMITVCNEYSGRAYEEQSEPGVLLDQFEVAADAVRGKISTTMVPAREAIMHAVTVIEKQYENRGQIGGISTGFKNLDIMCDGLHGANLYLFAGRPSHGKTALMMNIADHIAIGQNLPVGIFSLEMSREQLFMRLLLSRARVNAARVRSGFMSDRDFPAITSAAAKIATANNIWVDDTSAISIQEMRAKARRWKKEKDIRAIFMDYAQLGTSNTGRTYERRDLEIGEISGGLKAMSKELDLPVIVLAQINRKVEDRSSNRPKLSDMRESGALEQDADVAGLITRPECYAENDEDRAELIGQATLIIAKNRNGPVGDVPLTFIKEYATFEDRAECDEPQ